MPLTLDQLTWPRRTERLVLRPARPEDHAATFGFRSDPGVGHWIGSWTEDPQLHRWLFTDTDRLARTLLYELDGRVVGDLMLAVRAASTQLEVRDEGEAVEAEIGWSQDPSVGGRGLATEAVRELLAICFQDLGLRRVVASCYAGNETSWRLMERVGMRRETVARRDSLHRSGEWMDSYGYALLAEEWRGATGPAPLASTA
ncbi:GNAT family N-acetyltransferase [Auraticoccus monumenti]|uniref:Protein N-acetyltransferase, RimJ/RimL family n=1 Tax=Auraticoccus monumenti TaxID=675864 RepID=A0A1G6YQ83_9ACTN|nr:GNAT family protein [Auraticoccus monumenti]SDD91807.1 Protein N-acetyltransferase, RimJ/RimL family [Auraticoccus monumenti]